MEYGFKVSAYREPWTDDVALIIGDSRGVVRSESMALEPVTHGGRVRPTLTIAASEAQALFQQLWDAGFRPQDGTGSAGQLQATERHLNDMRALVVSAVGVELPK